MKFTEEEIKPFIDACNAMENSKFILVDKRIGDLLKSIATTKPVYNAIAESMINFNWSSSWKMATSKTGELILPEDPQKMVALIFCLLKNIDSGKVNINELLVRHFSNDEDRRSSYVVFCEKTIKPFKKVLINKLCQPEQKVVKQSEPVLPVINKEISSRLEFLVKDIKAYVMGVKKLKGCVITKQDYLDIIDTFLFAIKNEDSKYYKFFTTMLKKVNAKDKELNSRLNAILELIEHI